MLITIVFNINTNELTPFDREKRKKQSTNRKKTEKNQSIIIKAAQ